MKASWWKQSIVSDRRVARTCSLACALVGSLVMIFGIRRLSELDLDEAQLFTALCATLALAGVFVLLAFQFRPFRPDAERPSGC